MRRRNVPGEETVTVVYRLYPNSTQRRSMELHLDACRDVYNYLVEVCIKRIREGELIPGVYEMAAMASEYRSRFPQYKDVYAECMRRVSERVADAFATYRKAYKKDHSTPLPGFKSFRVYSSFSYPCTVHFGFVDDRLRLGKVGKVRYRNKYHPRGEPRTCTVKRDGAGNWSAYVTYRREIIIHNELSFENPKMPVGVDLGLKNIAFTSDGRSYPIVNYLEQEQGRITRLNTKMNGLDRDSPEYQKLKKDLAKVYMKVSSRRHNLLWGIANDIVDSASMVVLEKLNVHGMMKIEEDRTHFLNKKYMEASLGMLIRMIEFKAARAGIVFLQVNPRNTSRTCSRCGNVLGDLKLKDRVYVCPKCGFVIDRDYNAAINILNKGLKEMGLGTQTLPSG